MQDQFFKQAKAQGYVARSAFKLLEIHRKYRIISPGANCLDLGCSPGAWLQVACQALGPRHQGGLVLGVDITGTAIPKRYCDDRVKVLQADARELNAQKLSGYCKGFHVVLSDMCHATMGSAAADAARSLELATCAATLAVGDVAQPPTSQGLLQAKGHLVVKLLQGAGTQEFTSDLKQHFRKVLHVFPEASRQESREIFIVGLGRTMPRLATHD
ncbi:hypothetical protein WJX72_012235 [[Myrmecia] bisecta]|uniref:rRNA methyltransferase 2, mitochondrial n=1 Tax=[Myrmecia] bisecta TaxID=41462 RepID=A0AAW1Q8B4_9CHLO